MPSFDDLKTTNPGYWVYVNGTVPAWRLNYSGNVWDTMLDTTAAAVASIVPFTPAGVAIPQTVGASPWTYTAGTSPERIVISGGAVTAVKMYGVNITLALPLVMVLAPSESIVIFYMTTAPQVVVIK